MSRDNPIITGCNLDLHLANPTVALGDMPNNEVNNFTLDKGNACVFLTLDNNVNAAVVGLLENECMPLPSIQVEHSFELVELGHVDIDNIDSIPIDSHAPTSPIIGEKEFSPVNSAMLKDLLLMLMLSPLTLALIRSYHLILQNQMNLHPS